MTDVVKIIKDDDGNKTYDNYWHYSFFSWGSPVLLCTLQVYGEGEGGAEFIEKKGKVTCKHCIEIINEMKNIKQQDIKR